MAVESQGAATKEDKLSPNQQGFASFAESQTLSEKAEADGVSSFAARVTAFDAIVQSLHKHLLLKQDLVEHVNSPQFNSSVIASQSWHGSVVHGFGIERHNVVLHFQRILCCVSDDHAVTEHILCHVESLHTVLVFAKTD